MHILPYDFTKEKITNKEFCRPIASHVWIVAGDFRSSLPTQIHRKDVLNLRADFDIAGIYRGNMTSLHEVFQGCYGELTERIQVPIPCASPYRDDPESFWATERIAGAWVLKSLRADGVTHWWPKVGSYPIFEFNGTIEDLIGRPLEPGEEILTIELATVYFNIYMYISDERRTIPGTAWDTYASYNKFPDMEGPILMWTVKILDPVPPPSPPHPIFIPDLCSSPTRELAPDEQFAIKVTIVNQNEYYGGEYYVGAYCEGNYIDLVTGTINAGQQKSQTFTTTANTLIGGQITESRYLPYIVVTGYIDVGVKEETDRWSPTPLSVIVGVPPECTPGETKCVGYDLYTCNALREWELTEKNVEKCGYVAEEKRDPLDTFIRTMERIRPQCPIGFIEENWVKLTAKVIDITPKIPIMPG